MGDEEMEGKEAVRMRCCGVLGCGWVGGWEGRLLTWKDMMKERASCALSLGRYLSTCAGDREGKGR